MEKPFERIVISFNENAYNSDLSEIEKTAGVFNNKISDLENDHELKLSDKDIQKYFIDREDPEPLVKKLYTEYPKHLRDLGQIKITEFFANLKNDDAIRYSRYTDKIKVVKNKVIPDPEKVEALRLHHERSLDGERAKKAYDLHQRLYSNMVDLIAMAKESDMHTMVMTYFKYDKDFNVEPADLAYNKFNQ